MKIWKTWPLITLALPLSILSSPSAFAAADSCDTLTIEDICTTQGGQSFIVKLPDLFNSPAAQAFQKDIEDAVRASGGQAIKEKKSDSQFRLLVECTDNQHMALNISNDEVGTISTMVYSSLSKGQGIGFAMFPLDWADRKSISGSTIGAFAVLNKCELAKGHLEGVFFTDRPHLLFGIKELTAGRFGLLPPPKDADVPADDSVSQANDQTTAPVQTDKVNPFDFSGVYAFNMPQDFCTPTQDNLSADLRKARKKAKSGAHSSVAFANPNGTNCPLTQGHLLVDAILSDTPIINLDFDESFVLHLLDGPQWDGGRQFRMSVVNGDTTQVLMPLWQVSGKILDAAHPDCANVTPEIAGAKSTDGLCFTIFGPKGLFGPFKATKVRDIYREIHVRPPPGPGAVSAAQPGNTN